MTIDLKEISKIISRKYILLDNNVITKASDHAKAFWPFFKLLIDSDCKPIINPMVKFEYLRGARESKHRAKRQDFIDLINADQLPGAYTEQQIDLAISIANLYSKNNVRNPGIVDCSLAANLINFKSNLFLATTNHADFPTFLFKRVGVVTVATEKDVFPIGIYTYDELKAKALTL